MNWRLLAIPVSIVPLLILFLFTHASISDIFAVGLIPFTTSVVSIIGKIMLQAFRFKYFITEFIGPDVSSTGKIIYARLAGEFVTQTTPSYVGGELVRIAFLTKNGVPVGRAAWVTTMEIIADVFVGTTLAFIAGAVSIYNGGDFIGFAVILVAIPTLAFWLSLLVFSAKRNLRLPFFSKKILRKLMPKEKADRMIDSANHAIADLCKMSRENFNSVKAVKVFILGIALTLATFLLQGVSFMVLANAVGSNIGFLGSLLATSASTVLSTLPVTIGGSGLAELGIWAYISNLNGIPSLKDVLNNSQLSVIIAWRIASYHIPLIIMWIALMRLTVGKVSLENTNANSPFALDKKNNDLSKTTTDKKTLEESSDDKR
ncbi:MAG: flippase-like domain-containing protein [Nitrososphaeraceae archaeon]|nr:flippase-like domain-containing protein [Nitrososphaeraceae archaeon]